MVVNRKVTGTASSMPVGLAMGAGASLGLTLILAVIVAKLIDSGAMKETSIGYCAMGILLVSAMTGALVSSGKIKRKRLAVCGLSGAIYYILLLAMTALFFGGQYSGMGVTGLVVLCGSGLVILIGMRQGRGQGTKRVRKVRHR